MHLAIPFTLLMRSFVAAAPSIQISVEVTHMDAQNQADAVHSSEELVIIRGGPGHRNMPFNFHPRCAPCQRGPLLQAAFWV